MDQFELAIAGNTVTILYEDCKETFVCEADLANWCQLHGLQYEYLAEKKAYKISKIPS